jgi:hypothetical protein
MSDPYRLGGEMKVIRRRFVPNYYYRDLYLKLQGLNQGYKSVDESWSRNSQSRLKSDPEKPK